MKQFLNLNLHFTKVVNKLCAKDTEALKRVDYKKNDTIYTLHIVVICKFPNYLIIIKTETLVAKLVINLSGIFLIIIDYIF